MIRAGSDNTAEDEKERTIGRRGFTEEPTSKSRVKGRNYCERNEKVGGRGVREVGGKIRWT